MSDEYKDALKEPFIPAEMRPAVETDPANSSHSDAVASTEATQGRLQALRESPEGQGRESVSPPFWRRTVAPNQDALWTVLDGESVLLNLESGQYFNLNRVGT